MSLSVAQCRAARAMLGWSASDLAQEAGVGIMTVKRLEGGQPVNISSQDKLRAAFNSVGIVFLASGEASADGGEGIRLRPKPE